MNFLAHLYLSRHDDELMIGNFIADSVKGGQWKEYDVGVANGIRMHRMIDDFTDKHPVFRSSAALIRPSLGKYAGVVTDIFYDHFLAADFNSHSDESLPEFTSRVHALLRSHESMMPQRSQFFLKYMLLKNIPLPYASREGIGMVLTGMSRRANFDNTMHEGVKYLDKHYEELRSHFQKFFPEIIAFLEEKKESFTPVS